MSDLNPDRDLQPLWLDIRTRHLFTIMVLLALVGILFAAREHLGPYIFGITLAYFLLPIVRFIERLFPEGGRLASVRRPIATMISVILTIGGAILLITLLAQPVAEEMQELADAFPAYWEDLTDGETAGDWYTDNVPVEVQTWLNDNMRELGQTLLEGVAHVLAFFFNATGSVVSAVAAFAIVPIFMAYVLIDRPGAGKRIRENFPEAWVDDTLQALRITDGIMASYTRGVILSSAIVGTITGLGYWLIGIDLWVSLAVIAFLGEIVPILGPWIAFFVSFPVVLATEPDKAIPMVIVFGVIQAVEGWFISPKIQGESIELPSSMVLISLAIGGALGGAIGIVLALPATAIARALVVYVMRRLDHIRPEEATDGLLPDAKVTTPAEQVATPAAAGP